MTAEQRSSPRRCVRFVRRLAIALIVVALDGITGGGPAAGAQEPVELGGFASSLCALPDRDGDEVGELLIADHHEAGDETVVGWIVSGSSHKLLARLTAEQDFAALSSDAYRSIDDLDGDGIGEIIALGVLNMNRAGNGPYCLMSFDGKTGRSIKARRLPRSAATRVSSVQHCTVIGRSSGPEVHIALTQQHGSVVETMVYSVRCTKDDLVLVKDPLLRCEGQPPLTLWFEQDGGLRGVIGDSREHGLPPAACHSLGAPQRRFGDFGSGPLVGVQYVPAVTTESGSVAPKLLVMKANEMHGAVTLYCLDPGTLEVRESLALFSSSGPSSRCVGIHGPGSEAAGVIALDGNERIALATVDGHGQPVLLQRPSDPGQLLSSMQAGCGSSAVRLMSSAESIQRIVVVAASVLQPPLLPNAAFWVDERSARIHAALRRRDLIAN